MRIGDFVISDIEGVEVRDIAVDKVAVKRAMVPLFLKLEQNVHDRMAEEFPDHAHLHTKEWEEEGFIYRRLYFARKDSYHFGPKEKEENGG